MGIAVGSLLGDRYQLDRLVGTGNFARVFLATDRRLKRRVAVKVLDPALVAQSDFRARFEREAQRIAELEHPNILSTYDYGDAEGTSYVVAPFVDGGTLAGKLTGQGRLGLPEAGDYLDQAAAALDYAHERGIVHGDVKPQNMLLRDGGKRLLLADFGVAAALNTSGTPRLPADRGDAFAYLAPEQFGGSAGRASDIYALGCVLFAMITGSPPFTGTVEQVRYGHTLSAPPSFRERGLGQAPESLQIVIEIALARQPGDRFRTAGELAAAFREAIASMEPSGTTQVAIRPPLASNSQSGVGQATIAPPPPPLAAMAGGRAPGHLAGLAPPPGLDEGRVLAAKSWGWKIAHSWWVPVPFLTLSLLGWLAFLYIGLRARRVRWLIWALAYFTLVALALAYSGTTLSGWLILVAWFGSGGQAVVVAYSYLRRLAVIQEYPERRGWIL
jgi:serine/threonine-protein kinase